MSKKLPVQEIVDRYSAGESAWSLGKAYGVKEDTISKRLREAGIKVRTLAESKAASRTVVINGEELRKCLGCETFSPVEEYEYGKTIRGKCFNCHKSTVLMGKYGISLDAYKEILYVDQGGFCPLCSDEAPSQNDMDKGLWWPVDHNHSCCSGPKSCGKCVRGIICKACNNALPAKWDNPDWRKKALEWLDK